jgi:hypothetical protein
MINGPNESGGIAQTARVARQEIRPQGISYMASRNQFYWNLCKLRLQRPAQRRLRRVAFDWSASQKSTITPFKRDDRWEKVMERPILGSLSAFPWPGLRSKD